MLSHVLVEYDNEANLLVYYTRGADLISQERDGEKHYYLYDGHNSVRMLVDEEGNVSDTYIYDAFGNLIDSAGTTGNTYLYCGEEYNKSTGLYYLRARYMDPSNGTFISMDKYQGTIGAPISLHKYLYANANPVMNSDPTGYVTLGGLNTAMVMQGILSGMASGALISAGLNILRFLTRTDTSEPFNFGNLISDMILGAIMGGFFGGSYAYASAIQSFAIFTTLGISSAGFSGLSLYGAYEEWENGNEIMAFVNLGFATLGAFGSYKSFQGAARTPTGQKAMDWAKSVKDGNPNNKGAGNTQGGSEAPANTGRGKNNIKPDTNAQGAYSVYKCDPNTGKITNYKTCEPNPKNPSGFDYIIGYDGVGKPHVNKATGESLMPHVHDKTVPGGVRAPYPCEIPK